jgi:hypothetical protein
MTIGAWNVRRLPQIVTYLTDLGVIRRHPVIHQYVNYNNFFINLLDHPKHYHVSILPDDYRNETIKELKDFIADYNKKYNTDINSIFTQIFYELDQPFNLEAAKKFIHVSGQVDKLRNEDIFKTIPEMEVVREAVRGRS